MKIVGLTGGIGSGKSTILNWFKKQGVPCFESDVIGKILLDNDLRKSVIEKFGIEFYNSEGKLNRKLLAKKLFKNPEALASLNKIIHPEVLKVFNHFKDRYKHAPLIIKEAAILIESGAYKLCDVIILIKAPKDIRIKRVINRDGIKEIDILDRMKYQWSDTKKEKFADYTIENISLEKTYKQAKEIINRIKQ